MRSNYASLDCAASIVYANNAKNPSDLLKPSRDSYLLYECGAPDKSVHIQLCQDILLDSISLGNFELFSSSFRDIKLYGTNRYAYEATNWIALGSFSGSDERVEQLFALENPHHWVSHIRLDFLSHWGDEFYCPINTIGVHGTTMLDQSKTILEPGDEEEPDECAPRLEVDPCSVARSPLEAIQACCKPKLEHNGGSFYEVILARIRHLEEKTEKTNAVLRGFNASYVRETHQLHSSLQRTLEQVHLQHQTIAIQTLLLVVVVGYTLIKALARSDDDVYIPLSASASGFQSHEKLPDLVYPPSPESDEDTTLTLEGLRAAGLEQALGNPGSKDAS